jgi:hypothetical protein
MTFNTLLEGTATFLNHLLRVFCPFSPHTLVP